MTEEKAKVSIVGETTALTRSLSTATRSITKFAGGTQKRLSSALGSVGGQLTAIGGLATVGGFAAMANSALDFEEGLTRMAIQGEATAAQTDRLRNTMSQASNDFAISRRAILSGVSALVDYRGAVAATPANIRLISKAMTATGADARDLAGTMFALQDNFALDSSQLEAALSGVTAAGKAASIPLAELAQTLQQQAANLVQLTGQGTEGVAKTVAVLQVLRKGFGSAAEAGTGAKALVVSLKRNADKLKRKHKIRVYIDGEPEKGFRDIRDILVDIGNSRLAKNPTLLTEALGSSEAETAVRVLRKNLGVYDELVEAGRDHNTLQRDANKFLSSAVGRQQAAVNKLKGTLESTFTPETIEGFALALEATLALGKKLGATFLELAEAFAPLRIASDALAEKLADISGLNEQINLKSQAPQQLSTQAEAFGRGQIDKNLRAYLQKFSNATPGNIELKAAQRIARGAKNAGLVRNGRLDEAAAKRAFLGALGATQRSANAAQRDIAATRLAGVERALQLLAQNAQKQNQVAVQVDVKVDGDAQARAEIRKARSG